MLRLVLASTSPSRKLLLQRLQIPFEIIAPDVDETPLNDEQAPELVYRLAQQKAQAVAAQYPNSLIIGADQVGSLNNIILSKPLTYDNAVQQLQLLSGQQVRFFTGICLLNTQTNIQQLSVETFDVVFRNLSLTMIEHYLQKEHVLNCAGSFTIEGLGIALAEKLIGDDYTALIGLPLIRLVAMLQTTELHVL